MSATAALPWALGVAWGALLAIPIVRRGARIAITARATTLSVRPRARSTRPLTSSPFATRPFVTRWCTRTGVVARVLRSVIARRRRAVADATLARELPVAVDLLAVAVGAGCTPFLAVEVAARWSPAPLAASFHEVLRSCALGLDLESALDAMARRTPRLGPLADALLATERLGVPIGPVLARLAEEDRTAVRRAAEAQARRIPVRLLFPLVFLVLPAFVLLTVVPGLAAGLGRL